MTKHMSVVEFRREFRSTREPIQVYVHGKLTAIYIPVVAEDKRPEWQRYDMSSYAWKERMNCKSRNEMRAKFGDRKLSYDEDEKRMSEN